MEIVKDCSSPLAVSDEDVTCIDDIIKYITHVVVGKNGTSPTCANGEYPTKAEMQSYLTAGNGYIQPVTNATKPAPTLTEFSGADTYEGQTVVAQQTETVTVRFKNVDNEFRVMARANNLNNQVGKVWFVAKMDTGNYIIIGGVDGYKTNTFIPEWTHEGYGTQSQYIEKTYTWETKQASIDLFSSEDDYNELTNVVTVGVYDLIDETGTSSTTFVAASFAGVTGWDKTTYPILYAKVTTASEVTFYPSDADRTAGTNDLANVDVAVSTTVNDGSHVGTTFGGSIEIAAFTLVATNTFKVTYSQY